MIFIKIRSFFIYFSFIILCTTQSHEAIPEEQQIPGWSAGDMLSYNSSVSLLRYSPFGLGAYPYRYSLPSAGLKVFVDRIPMRSFSPFGPDLELIPSEIIDSLEFNGCRNLNMVLKNVSEEKPVTTTSFLLGSKHRFNYEMSFLRRLGENAGILFCGSSSGIHGSNNTEDNSLRTEKNSLRNYILKYQRFLDSGGTLNISAHAFRDRDGLVDLNSLSHMGERKTDFLSTSLAVDEYPLGEKTVISPVFYYQSGYSRFHRYGFRKSLDDNNAGLNVLLSTRRGNTSYGLNLLHDMRFFNSRIHDESWKRNETELTASFAHEYSWYNLKINGGLVHSSEYGDGSKVEGELVLTFIPKQEFVIRGFITDEFPDIGKEYYTSLIFSDTTIVSDLKKYTISEVEAGWKINRQRFEFGIFGFGSSSDAPLFRVSSSALNSSVVVLYPFSSEYYMSSRRESAGYRVCFRKNYEKSYQFKMKLNFSQRIKMPESDSADFRNWPYPSMEFFSDMRLSRKCINDRLTATIFGDIRIMRWNDGNSSPYGNHYFLNCGLSLKVSTLELFYTIENITNEDIQWFNTLGWLDRNAMWGIRWKFLN